MSARARHGAGRLRFSGRMRDDLEVRSPGVTTAFFVGFLAVLGWSSLARAESEPLELQLEDFAIGRELVMDEVGPLQFVLLDYSIYRRSIEPGLADLRVFDMDGKPLPYAIRRRLPGTRAAAPSSVSLPVFRLGAVNRSPASSKDTADGGDYRIDAEISASGAIVRIRPSGDRDSSSDATPEGWLLDTSSVGRAIVGLDFSLAEGGGDFVSRMRLESSSDLAHFETIDANLALVRLEQGGHRIERTSFEIPKTTARYLRIMPIGADPLPELLGVRARLASTGSRPRFSRETIVGRFDPEDPGTVRFDLGAMPPLETLRVMLPEPDSIVEGRLESAPSPDGPWRLRQRGVFYFFERAGALRNPGTSGGISPDRFFRLVTSERGGGLRGEPPSLEVVWRPEQLLFLKRGPGVAMLGVGRIGTPDGGFDASDLLRMGHRSDPDAARVTVELGPEIVLAGDRALERTTPVPWKTYGLWALLLASVGIVLGLSLRLMRGSGDHPEQDRDA